jgi:hypothetical protein
MHKYFVNKRKRIETQAVHFWHLASRYAELFKAYGIRVRGRILEFEGFLLGELLCRKKVVQAIGLNFGKSIRYN